MKNRVRKFIASAAIVAGFALGLWGGGAATIAGGETRSISLYHIHTKESLTITYMVNGKYVPSAMKKINYLMRDWRRKETITIDPRTIDLMWELHADLGSKAPIHIVCGYRSPRTNAFLKRVGRNVARKSQHMKGKAIDLYFPDVNTKTMRNSALVRQVGGVGYYRSSAGPTGFLHIDSGNVRHWGPGISRREMAGIFSKYRKTVGARLNGKDRVMVATRETAKGKPVPTEPSIYDGLGDEVDDEANAQLASLTSEAATEDDAADANVQPEQPGQPVLVDEKTAESVTKGYPVPKPRPKPIEVLMMAAANMQIEPASAPPPTQIGRTKPIIAGVALATVDEPSIDDVIEDGDQTTNKDGKGGFAEDLNAIKPASRKMKPIVASTSSDINWWPEAQAAETQETTVLDQPAPVAEQPQVNEAVIEASDANADGKGDMLVIDRSGKGSLPAPLPALIKG